MPGTICTPHHIYQASILTAESEVGTSGKLLDAEGIASFEKGMFIRQPDTIKGIEAFKTSTIAASPDITRSTAILNGYSNASKAFLAALDKI